MISATMIVAMPNNVIIMIGSGFLKTRARFMAAVTISAKPPSVRIVVVAPSINAGFVRLIGTSWVEGVETDVMLAPQRLQ